MVGLALLGVVALFALSGYLLPWDQKGYWAKLVEATITGSAPVVGGATQQLIQGGAAFGNHDADARLRAARDGAAGAADRRCWCSTSTCSGATATRRSGRCRPRTRPRAPCRPGRTRRLRNAVVGRAGVGRRRGRRDRAPRRAAGVARRSDVELPGAPRVVRAAAVPAAHVLRGAAGDRRDDDHPRHRDGAGVRAAVPRSRVDATAPPIGARVLAARRAGPAGADRAGA